MGKKKKAQYRLFQKKKKCQNKLHFFKKSAQNSFILEIKNKSLPKIEFILGGGRSTTIRTACLCGGGWPGMPPLAGRPTEINEASTNTTVRRTKRKKLERRRRRRKGGGLY